MRVRWTADAADDLERICDYIAEDRPDAARRVAQSVVERIGTLETFPHLGRVGRVQGTREIAFPSAPVRRHLRSSRGTDSRLASPSRSAALAERTLASSMLPLCSVCGWEDDGVQLANPTSSGGANRQSLAEVQAEVIARIPLEVTARGEVERDPLWRPLNRHELDEAETKRRLQHWHTPATQNRMDAYWLRAAPPADTD